SGVTPELVALMPSGYTPLTCASTCVEARNTPATRSAPDTVIGAGWIVTGRPLAALRQHARERDEYKQSNVRHDDNHDNQFRLTEVLAADHERRGNIALCRT